MSHPFSGHGMLLGPEQYSLGHDPLTHRDLRVSSAEDYKLWHAIVVTGLKGQCWRSPEKTTVVVNHGKWMAMCHWCHKWMLTRPDWALACCSECGAWYEGADLVFPSDPRIIELLLKRPDRDTQHWDELQNADDLLSENEELGL